MPGHYGPMMRALAHNRRDYRVLVFATAVGYTVVVQALAFASMFKTDIDYDYGFDNDRIAVVTMEPESNTAAALSEVEQALRAAPGVEELAWVARRPFRFTEFGEQVAPLDDAGNAVLAWPSVGDEHLLSALGLPILTGRNIVPSNNTAGADVEVVVTASLARFLSGKDDLESALGTRFLNGISGRVMRIVGATRDVCVQSTYVPNNMHTLFTYSAPVESRRRFAILRVANADATTLGAVSAAARDRGYWVETLSLRQMRTLTSATSRGAKKVQVVVIATVLFVGLIGTFGAASFSVAERTRQIGIRRALGATRGQITRYFLEENLMVTTGGILLGVPMALGVGAMATRMQQTFILEWPHFAIAAFLFYCTSLWGAHAPALKASRIPPSVVSQAA